jgi:hypothetical protein
MLDALNDRHGHELVYFDGLLGSATAHQAIGFSAVLGSIVFGQSQLQTLLPSTAHAQSPISSPETEAELRATQTTVLRAKQALAEVVAIIAQRNKCYRLRFNSVNLNLILSAGGDAQSPQSPNNKSALLGEFDSFCKRGE